METVLVIATLVLVLIVITVLAVYLVVIARTLRSVSRTLGQITFGVRAIDTQTDPMKPSLHDINAALERTANLLEQDAGLRSPTT